MKSGNDWLVDRHWLIIFAIGAFLFLFLSLFWGYTTWENSTRDAENIQKIREFQALSKNVLFFSQKTITGDASAIDPLVSTVETMDSTIEFLLQADDFTKSTLDIEYEVAINFWRSIRNNSAIISDVEYAINLINAVSIKLDQVATEAQEIIAFTVENAVAKGASKEQLSAIAGQALLLRKMANSMGKFTEEMGISSESFDAYRGNLVAFDNNYEALINGDASRNISSLEDTGLQGDVEGVNQFVSGVRTAEESIVNAVEALLLARDAHSKVSSSFEGLQLTLDDMRVGFDSLQADRFSQSIHVLLAIIATILCVIGFVYAQRQSTQRMIEAEQAETENVQAAILRLLDELADLADGDLTVTTTVSEDFTGAIADSVNYSIDQLRQLVSRINKTAVQVSAAAQESQQTALQLAEASDHQAQEIAGASAAINEMAVTIDRVSANAAESALVASKSVSIANNGAKLVQNTTHGMHTIREQIQDTSKRIKRLGESSQEIGDIVSLINDIADQTNILSLNAAIQASMAGDAGRGFAVVADEVQRLAERSANATKQIKTLVKTIQTDTNEAVNSMEQTTTEVVSGAQLAQDAGVALEEIECVSANLAELIQNISNAARQQASSAGHISNTMNVIQEITSQTSAGTGATAQSIGDLADMALELRESVAGFTLPDDMGEDLDIDAGVWLSAGEIEETPSFTADMASDSVEVNDDSLDLEEVLNDLTRKGDDEQFDFSSELSDIADSEGIDLDAEDFDLSDFDFSEVKDIVK